MGKPSITTIRKTYPHSSSSKPNKSIVPIHNQHNPPPPKLRRMDDISHLLPDDDQQITIIVDEDVSVLGIHDGHSSDSSTSTVNCSFGPNAQDLDTTTPLHPTSPALQELPDTNVSRALECPVCLEIPIDLRIYNCFMGHSICENCYDPDTQCHTCKSNFNGARNFVVEALIKLVAVKCKYADCGAVMKGDDMAEHLKICQYRPIPCFDNHTVNCNGTLISQKDFVNHIKTMHHQKSLQGNYFRSEIVSSIGLHSVSGPSIKMDYSIAYIEFDNRMFVRHMTIINGLWYCWISFVGTEQDASKYFGRITIVDSFKPLKKQMSWGHLIHSGHHSREDMETLGDCARVPVEWLGPYLTTPKSDEDGDGLVLETFCSVTFKSHHGKDFLSRNILSKSSLRKSLPSSASSCPA